MISFDLFAALILGSILGKLVFFTSIRLPEMEEIEIRDDLKAYFQLELASEPTIPRMDPDFFNKATYWFPFWYMGAMVKSYGNTTGTKLEVVIFEVISFLLVFGVIQYWGYTLDSVFILALVSLTSIALVVDLSASLLPEKLTYGLMWIGLLHSIYGETQVTVNDAILGVILGYLLMNTLNLVNRWWKGNIAFAYGDLRLIAALGAWVGFKDIYLVVIISLTIFVVLNFTLSKKNYPFAPVILFSFYSATLFTWVQH
ncbi:prepilin peptidase [Vibrio chagasii]|uniref:Prepilin peptidase n=2 Tax=Vibrio chagasii TaxID=170679 RepID=A0A7V7NX58_9VIBR|nr:prepilin peptidase [Vibrio chagasii]